MPFIPPSPLATRAVAPRPQARLPASQRRTRRPGHRRLPRRKAPTAPPTSSGHRLLLRLFLNNRRSSSPSSNSARGAAAAAKARRSSNSRAPGLSSSSRRRLGGWPQPLDRVCARLHHARAPPTRSKPPWARSLQPSGILRRSATRSGRSTGLLLSCSGWLWRANHQHRRDRLLRLSRAGLL